MRFARFEPDHIFAMEVQPEQAPWFTLSTARAVAEAMAEHEAWTGFDGDAVIGCGGAAPIEGGVTLAWGVFSPRIAERAKPMLAFSRRLYAAHPAERIEAHIFPGHPRAGRWAEACGFGFEGVFARHPSGIEGVALYARVRT